MNEVVVSLGSNCADRQQKMNSAIKWILSLLENSVISSVYETPAIGGGAPYLNAVAKGKSDLTSVQINSLFKSFEMQSGRDERCRQNGLVPIDIDLVIFNDKIVRPVDFKREFFQIGYKNITGK